MTLSVYNTLTRHKSAFQTIEEHKVRMYCCGITVYDYCHLGHARTCLVWDVVRRYLQWSGYEVNYIQNFTDIDDKILKRASQEGTSMEAVSEKYIAAYFEDMERLGVGQADAYPRATHTLDGIKRLVAELEQKGFAYPAEGDVYYEVQKFPDYGKLSGRKLADMQAGASGRVEEDPEASKKRTSTADGFPAAGDWSKKRYPFDFALWKAAKEGEPAWESPWGNGRPGWHIECSAMVRERLGETIDLHVGGGDLTFPHHENEIAQSEAVTGQPLANYWLHNGMIIVEGKKMSKSLGNFTTIRELLDQYEPMAVRLFILQAQYRKPVDFTTEALSTATNSWSTLKEGLLFGHQYGKQLGFATMTLGEDSLSESLVSRFKTAVDDDFNFAEGLAVLFEIAKNLSKEGNILVHEGTIKTNIELIAQQWRTLVELASILGFTANLAENSPKTNGLSDAEIDALVQQRNEARNNKNYAQSDRLRDELQAQGITLIDQKGVTKWIRG
jgi:cysteinyl-tRNA synthetase